MPTNIFLSSNSREGYSQDVVDLFAKPNGDTQVFRYALTWISEEVTARPDWETIGKGESALLCYVDQKTKNVTPKIVPVRFAKISEIRRHGTTVSIVFQLEGMCKFGDLEDFNTNVRSLWPELPNYSDKKLEGKYWLRVPSMDDIQCEPTNDLGDWERLVEAYYETPMSLPI